MKKFKDLGITATNKKFVGDKVQMFEILNKEIIIFDYKIENSKYNKDDKSNKCLHMQIGIDNVNHVVFTGSIVLMDLIQKVPKDEFPFSTTIVKSNKRFEFT